MEDHEADLKEVIALMERELQKANQRLSRPREQVCCFRSIEKIWQIMTAIGITPEPYSDEGVVESASVLREEIIFLSGRLSWLFMKLYQELGTTDAVGAQLEEVIEMIQPIVNGLHKRR